MIRLFSCNQLQNGNSCGDWHLHKHMYIYINMYVYLHTCILPDIRSLCKMCFFFRLVSGRTTHSCCFASLFSSFCPLLLCLTTVSALSLITSPSPCLLLPPTLGPLVQHGPRVALGSDSTTRNCCLILETSSYPVKSSLGTENCKS